MNELYPYSIYYRSSSGEELHFDEAPYSVASTDLFDSLCRLNAVSRPLSEGSRILSRYRECDVRTLKIIVFGQSQSEHNAAMNRLSAVLGSDLETLQAGRLYVNRQYLRCYVNQSEKQVSHDWSTCTAVTLTITPEYPYWCIERSFSYYPGGDTSDASGRKYPRKYPSRYASAQQSLRLVNTHYAACPMLIMIYGPAADPRVCIGNILCGLNLTLEEGEYAVIDQMTREIYKRNVQGQTANMFDKRVKEGNIFTFAPPGSSQLFFNGEFGVDIVIVEQRSEPLWN